MKTENLYSKIEFMNLIKIIAKEETVKYLNFWETLFLIMIFSSCIKHVPECIKVNIVLYMRKKALNVFFWEVCFINLVTNINIRFTNTQRIIPTIFKIIKVHTINNYM